MCLAQYGIYDGKKINPWTTARGILVVEDSLSTEKNNLEIYGSS